jgi:hypothetical protein
VSLVGVPQPEAAARFEIVGKRLWNEHVLERRCVLDAVRPFPTGATLDVAVCRTDASRCASASGALELGLRVAEWTSSASSDPASAILRGSASTELPRHRCAARQALAAATSDAAVGFRCCRGEGSGATPYPAVTRRATFRESAFELDAIRRALASVPEVARFASDFTLYGEVEAMRALGRGGKTIDDLLGWVLVKQGLRWEPVPGEEIWVFHGASGGHGVLVALYPIADGFAHAGTFAFEGEPNGVAIAYTPPSPRELKWSTCWGCAGENGVLLYDESGRLVIRQQ